MICEPSEMSQVGEVINLIRSAANSDGMSSPADLLRVLQARTNNAHTTGPTPEQHLDPSLTGAGHAPWQQVTTTSNVNLTSTAPAHRSPYSSASHWIGSGTNGNAGPNQAMPYSSHDQPTMYQP